MLVEADKSTVSTCYKATAMQLYTGFVDGQAQATVSGRRTLIRCRLPAASADGIESAFAQVFDVAAVRAALQGRLHSLESELHQVLPASEP